MWAQAHMEGNEYTLLNSIIDQKKTSDAMEEQYAYITTQSGKKRRRGTIKGWLL